MGFVVVVVVAAAAAVVVAAVVVAVAVAVVCCCCCSCCCCCCCCCCALSGKRDRCSHLGRECSRVWVSGLGRRPLETLDRRFPRRMLLLLPAIMFAVAPMGRQ